MNIPALSNFIISNNEEDLDLAGLKFKGGKISDYSFEEVNFQKCNVNACLFDKSSFYNTQLSESVFEDCTFIHCDFTMSEVFKTHFKSCVFIDCTFIKWDLLETEILECSFYKGDFKLADFSSGVVKHSKFILPQNHESIKEDDFFITPI